MRVKRDGQSVKTDTLRRDIALRRLQTGLDALFPVLYGCYIFNRASLVTTLALPWPKNTSRFFLIALMSVGLARLVVCTGFKRVKVWIALAVAVICYLSYRAGGYMFLNFLCILFIGMIGIDCRKLFRCHVVAVLSVLAIALMAASTGCVQNIVYCRGGVRSSWGICYPTDFSTYVLFALIALWAAWDRLPDWAMLLISLITIGLSLCVTGSRNSQICSFLFFFAIAYLIFERRVIDGRPRLRWVKHGVDGFLTAALPLFALATYLMVFLYAKGNPAMVRLNDALTDRLQLCLNAVQKYGLRPFGAKFSMAGLGFSTFPNLANTFIDCSYVLIPVRYGWVLFLALSGLWVAATVRVIRCGHRRLAIALALIAFHSIIEHHFIEIHYNAFLALLFASLPAPGSLPEPGPLPAPGNAIKSEHGAPGRRRAVEASAIAVAALAGMFFLMGPRALTRLRTAFHALNWQGGGRALPVILLALAAIVAGVWAAYSLAFALLSRKRVCWRTAASALLCVLLCAGGYLWTGQVIAGATADSAATLEAEDEAMRTVVGAATGGVYVDTLPNVYMRRYGGIRPTVLAGEDLARYDGATVITDAASERNVFFQRGYRYAQISDAHAVYTADPAVIDALGARYALTDYWSTPMQVDLEKTAKQNHLTYGKYGMLLNGSKKRLKKGPRADLYEGCYEVTYELVLPKKTMRKIDKTGEDALVCTLRVTAFKRAMTLNEVPVYRSQFNEKRRLKVTVPFAMAGARDVDYLALTESGMKVYIRRISCRKTGRV